MEWFSVVDKSRNQIFRWKPMVVPARELSSPRKFKIWCQRKRWVLRNLEISKNSLQNHSNLEWSPRKMVSRAVVRWIGIILSWRRPERVLGSHAARGFYSFSSLVISIGRILSSLQITPNWSDFCGIMNISETRVFRTNPYRSVVNHVDAHSISNFPAEESVEFF